MPGFLTSYAGLFSSPEADAPGVTSVEIPLIQRDYAQGRTDARTSQIRPSTWSSMPWMHLA